MRPDDEPPISIIDGVDTQIGPITNHSSDNPLKNTIRPTTADLRTSSPPQSAIRPRTTGYAVPKIIR